MSNWTVENKNHVSRCLQGIPCKFIGVNVSTGKATAFSADDLLSIELVLGYDEFHHLYVAWNPYVHTWHAGVNVTLFCGINSLRLRKKDFTAFLTIYRPMKGGQQREKVVVIREAFIEEFCENFREYMMPHPEDEGFSNKVVYADKNSSDIREWKDQTESVLNLERRYVTCKKFERDAAFREKCLSAYKRQCVICGCSTEVVLQAAHIVPVSEGGNDDVANSVCLCANHHLMYDKKLLTIDWNAETFSCECPTEETMPWYIEAQKAGFKLLHTRTKCP